MKPYVLIRVIGGVINDVAMAGTKEAIQDIFNAWTDEKYAEESDIDEVIAQINENSEDENYGLFEKTVPWLRLDGTFGGTLDELKTTIY